MSIDQIRFDIECLLEGLPCLILVFVGDVSFSDAQQWGWRCWLKCCKLGIACKCLIQVTSYLLCPAKRLDDFWFVLNRSRSVICRTQGFFRFFLAQIVLNQSEAWCDLGWIVGNSFSYQASNFIDGTLAGCL